MLELEEDHPDIFEFHEGMLGGINDRGEQTSIDTYEGWYYGHASPWDENNRRCDWWRVQ